MPAPDSTTTVQQQFGAVAAAYATSSYHATGADLGALVQAGEFTGRERVLDLGCGAGHAALRVAPHVREVVGLDVTAEMVAVATDLARRQGVVNVAFQEGDVQELPFVDGWFDVVTSRQSAHHYADPAKALAEAFRVLRSGGLMLLIDTVAPEDPALDTFLNCFEVLRDSSHVRDWRASEWLRMFAHAGFEQIEVLDRYPIAIDGAAWVERMRTPPEKVTVLKLLFGEATEVQRKAFELHMDEPWGLSVPGGLLRAVRP